MANSTKQSLTLKKRKELAALDIGWYKVFLESLRNKPNVATAAQKAGVSRVTVYEHRKKFPDLAEAWDVALDEGIENLEGEAMRRAFEGVDKPVIYKGKISKDTYKEYSDTLAIFLLKAHRPEKYRDRWEVKIASWQDDIVQSLKDGTIDPADVQHEFADIASQLLLRAGKL